VLQVYPDYYPAFRCIAGDCRHSCCVGWEIDIDEETLARYDAVPGEFGQRLRQSIRRGGETPCFRLGAEERCPFLNDRNLCDIILTLGEDALCQICDDHPRFRNFFPERTETGLGLCCEAAGALILGQAQPMTLVCTGAESDTPPMAVLRDAALALTADESLPLEQALEQVLELCGGAADSRDMGFWAEFLLLLERLEPQWGDLLTLLQNGWRTADLTGFDAYMMPRQQEYRRFADYLIYRHLTAAVNPVDAAARAGFAALGYRVLRTLGALLWQRQGAFTFAHQVELARLFSAELEYSEDNLDAVLDALAEPLEE